MKVADGNWTVVHVAERNENGVFKTEGRDLQLEQKTHTFDQYKPTGDLFSAKSYLGTVLRNLGYLAFAIPHRAVTTVGNTVSTVVHSLNGVRTLWSNYSTDGLDLKAAFSPAGRHLGQAVIDVIVPGSILGLLHYGYFDSKAVTVTPLVLTNSTVVDTFHKAVTYLPVANATNFVILASVLLAAYAVYNPKKTQVSIKSLEKGPLETLSDKEVKNLGWFQTVIHLTDGSYSLSRIFNLDCKGNVNEKTGSYMKYQPVQNGNGKHKAE